MTQKEEILKLLKSKPGQFVEGDLICGYIGLKSKVILRGLINEMRTEGQPIISNSKGYKYSTDVVEIVNCITALKNRANKILVAAEGMASKVEHYKE